MFAELIAELQEERPKGLAHIDWLTCTAKNGPVRKTMKDTVEHMFELGCLDGRRRKPWRWLGYEGESVGSVRWGRRVDGDIVVASGEYAELAWLPLAGAQDNVSRIDLAQDFVFPDDHTPGVEEWWETQQEKIASGGSVQKPMTKIVNLEGGLTIYWGKRGSEVMLRVYDKGAQTKTRDIGEWWRVEAEFKGRAALNRWLRILGAADRRRAMTAFLQSISRSAEVPDFLVSSVTEFPPRLQLEASSNESSIAWLHTQVRPAIIRLEQDGLLERVEQALGYQLNLFETG